MKLNIFMQSNNVERRENAIFSVLFNARALVLTMVITMTMVMGTALFTNSIAYAQSGDGATVRVATFDQLRDALGNGGVSDIIIDPQAAEEFADNEGTEISFDGSDVFYIPIEYPLVVSHDVTITSEAAVNFARSGNGGGGKYDSKAFKGQNEVTPALFNVDQGKTLVLEGDIAMTGEEVSATFDSAQGSFLFTVKARDNLDDEDDEDDNDAWSYGSDPGKLSTGGYFIYSKGGNVVMNDGVLLMGLNTLDNVKDIAPVYIDGTAKAATLTVDGAEIVDNNLGKTEDGNSTAGAVILKGSNATAALNSGEISNNNADVAGIIVKEDAALELGNDFGINDSDIYDEKAEEAAKEEAAKEETAKEETEEAPIVVAPKKSMKSSKSSATQMRSAGNQTTTSKTPNDPPGTATVATSSQLEAALADTSITTIIVDPTGALKVVSNKDSNNVVNPSEPTVGGTFYLPVDKPLTIAKGSGSRSVTIKTKDGKEAIIARSDLFTPSSSNPAIFNVPDGVTLTLDSKITMTGDKVTSKYKDGTNSHYDPGQSYEAATSVDLKLVATTYALVKIGTTESSFNLGFDSDTSKGIVFQVENGFLKYGNMYVCASRKDQYSLKNNPDIGGVEVRDPSTGNKVSSITYGSEYVLYNPVGYTPIGYLYIDDNGNVQGTDNPNAGLRFKAVGPNNETSGAAGGKAYKEVTFDYTVESDYTWTATDIPGSDYRGFFIHAADGGTVNIQGDVTLQNLKTKTAFTNGDRQTVNGVEYWTYTSDTVTNAAPVYIGGGSTLNMTGGKIQNNRVGYAADENDSSSSIQWLKKRLGEQAFPTNTAGGIIVSGSGTEVNIKGSAKISDNQADAGALIIKDNALVTMDNQSGNKPEISGNIGWHHSGGALVESGGTLHLKDGKINNNIAWGKGGAVWATEWGTNGWVVWNKYPDTIKNTAARQTGGNFIMDGGELSGNFAFVRGGAIEVESNGVTLNGGEIKNNKCKSLGGAMYIEGDSPVYTYSVIIQKGFISDNTAVKGANSDLDKTIKNNKLDVTDPNKPYASGYHYDKDFAGWNADGDGGGVWLCSMGGTSVFTSDVTNANQQVIIDNNTAARSGDDFFVSAKKGAALIQNLLGDWYYDTDNADNPLGARVENIDPAMGKVIHGRRGLVNGTNPNYTDGQGIKITGNMARDGGGIACNGTIIMGKPQNVYRYETELELKKTWDDGLTKEPVTLSLYYEYPTGSNNWHKLTAMQVNQETGSNTSVNYDITLGNDVQTPGSNDSNPAATNVIYQTDTWEARASIPAYTQHKDGDNVYEVPLYRIKKPGTTNEYYDLVNSKADIEALYNYYNTQNADPLEVEWNIQVRENSNKYIATTVGGTTATANTRETSTVTVTDAAGGTTGSFSVFYTTVTLNQTVKNYANGEELELTKKKGILKQDNSLDKYDVLVDGAQFNVYRTTKKTEGGVTFYERDTTPVGTAASVDGTIKLPIAISLDSGEKYYWIEETSAPAGYVKAEKPWLMVLDNKNGERYVKQVMYTDVGVHESIFDGNKWKHGKWRTTFQSGSSNTDRDSEPTLYNQPYYLTKVDLEGAAGNSPTILSGATFKLYSAHRDKAGGIYYYCKGKDFTNSANKSEYDLIGDEKGIIELPGEVTSSAGKYLLFEETPPLTYKKATKPWLVEVDANGKITVKSIEDHVTEGEGYDQALYNRQRVKWWPENDFKIREWSELNRIPNELDRINLKAKKVWVDKDGKTTSAPSNITSITFHLNKIIDGERTLVDTGTINSNNWNAIIEFNNLPKYRIIDERAEEIRYEIIEEAIAGYVPSYEIAGDTTTVKNKPFSGGSVKLTIDKKWQSLNGELESIKPTSIMVDIYCDLNEANEPVEYKKDIEILASNKWVKTVTNLPMYAADGRRLKYWVKEQSVEGFVPVTVYSEASDIQNDKEKDYVYTGYTWDNSAVGSNQWIGAKLHKIIKPDGDEEIVYCLNVQYGPPSNEGSEGTKYKRVEVTKNNASTVLKSYMHESDYYLEDGTKSGRTYSVGYTRNDYTKLYYALLKLAYYGYGGQDNSWIKTNNLDSRLIRHLTQFAVYEYTDFYYDSNNDSRDYTVKAQTGQHVYHDMWGYTYYGHHYGPFGLINNHSTTGKNQLIYNKNSLQNDYLALLGEIENTQSSEIDKLGLKLYIYEPVVKTNSSTGRKYQNLIGVETAASNMYATIENKVKYEEINLFKYGVKTYDEDAERTSLNGVVFTLYEPDANGQEVDGINEKVKITKDNITTSGTGDDEGKAKISGLLPGRTYYLVEKTAKNGYIKPTKPIKFKLSNVEANGITPVENYDWNEDKDEEIVLKYGATLKPELKVANKQIYDLPKSGGMGTYWFMVIGAMMMGFALTAGFTKLDLLSMFRR